MLKFIPEPKQVTPGSGVLHLPRRATIAIADGALYDTACLAREVLGGGEICAAAGLADTLVILLTPTLPKEGYHLAITPDGITLQAADAAGAFYGVQTLAQVARQSPPGTLVSVTVDDAPDFPDRGVYYDVCRGRVAALDRLKEQADLLAHYKINQIQLYMEHTFRFRQHPEIGKNASPLTAEDILELDAFCRARHIELVPSLAAFGHLATVLNLPQYRHLAEDWGEGRYEDPEAKSWWATGWSLTPAREESYVFLKELFDELLPCFSSKRFNVCCDENYDLGWGQSYRMAQKMGKGRLYLSHIVRLRDLAASHGKQIMFWGDIIRHYPELIPEIPTDVTVLDWGYEGWMDFDRVKDFTATGLPSYGCPSVCGYVTLFPRVFESADNIAGWAQACKQHGGTGILNTDWGDGGHYNFMECAWPGYLFGAEQSWNANADRASFWARFNKLFLAIEAPEFLDAFIDLGDIAQVAADGFYQSFWRHVFFAAPGDEVLKSVTRKMNVSTRGVREMQDVAVNAALGREAQVKLEGVRQVMAAYTDNPDVDPHEVLPYWLFAVDALLHAAKKLAVLGDGGTDTPAARQALAGEMLILRDRFQSLWYARSRPSEIHVTLGYYDHAIEGLLATEAVKA
ncbi:MAG: beta-N-acetylhexosaminidase [Armatimonadota bacterium]